MANEEYIVTGYIYKVKNIYSLVLGRYRNGRLLYKGHITLGVSAGVIKTLVPTGRNPFSILPKGNENAIWVAHQVCTVEYIPNTKGAMRQPVFKGMLLDVYPEEVEE